MHGTCPANGAVPPRSQQHANSMNNVTPEHFTTAQTIYFIASTEVIAWIYLNTFELKALYTLLFYYQNMYSVNYRLNKFIDFHPAFLNSEFIIFYAMIFNVSFRGKIVIIVCGSDRGN